MRRASRNGYRKSRRGGKFKKGQPVMRQIKALQTQVKKLSKETKPELKYFDTITATNAPGNAGDVINLMPIIQGTDANNRIGDTIRIRKSWGRLHIDQDASSDTSVRVILFKDKQPNGQEPLPAEVLQTINFMSPLNMDFKERFHIYKDKTYTLNVARTTTLDPKMGKRMMFTSRFGSPTQTVPNTDGLFLLLISNRVDTNVPTIDIYWRTRYTDV